MKPSGPTRMKSWRAMPSRAARSWATSASAQRFPNFSSSVVSFISSIPSCELRLDHRPGQSGADIYSPLRRPLVDQHDDAVANDSRFLEPQVAPLRLLVENLFARTENYRKDHQVDLVDEIAFKQLLDELVAARHLQLAVELILELAHLGGRVAAIEDRCVVPLRILERRRDDELRHRVELVGELTLTLRPGAGEALKSASADHEGVGLPCLVQLELVPVLTAIELEAPPRVFEGFASRRLHHAVKRYEFGYNDPCCHLSLLGLGKLSL